MRPGRRRFLKNAATGAAALVSAPLAGQAPPAQGQSSQAPEAAPATTDVYTTDRPGADFMVDVIKSLGFEYVAANPGSSFAALHESIVNYGGNRVPELLTCLHEESSVAMAHGYAKIEGKPMMVMAHGTVGLQHAAMAVYNAYADRVPVYIVLGNILDAQWRRSDPQWAHAVQDCAAMVRDCTKWDDTPASLVHFAESSVRAYKIAMTPPHGPVIIVADATMQEEPIPEEDRHRLRVPRLAIGSPPAGDPAAVDELAKMLVAANDPVIITGRAARTPKGLSLMIELAELLQAPVRDPAFVQRMNFPSRHRLRGGDVSRADLVLGLEVPDFYQQVNAVTPNNRVGMASRRITKAGAKIATISSHELLTNSNYQDFGRYNEVDLAITADAEATLPSLIEACRRLITPDRRRLFDERGGAPGRGGQGRARPQRRASGAWLGCQPDHHGAAVGRVVERDQGRGLVPRLGRVLREQLAAQALGLHEALPLHRLVGCLRHRLRSARGGRRGARQSQARTDQREHPVRRRPELCARRALDRGASQDPVAHRHAQQPRVSHGADVHHDHGRASRARRQPREHRQRACRAVHRSRGAGQGLRRVRCRTDRESERPRSCDQAGARGGQARRASAGRCHYARTLTTPVEDRSKKMQMKDQRHDRGIRVRSRFAGCW